MVWVEWNRETEKERGREGRGQWWRGQPDEVAEGSLLLIHGVTGLGSAHPKESLEVRCLGAIRLDACSPILYRRGERWWLDPPAVLSLSGLVHVEVNPACSSRWLLGARCTLC